MRTKNRRRFAVEQLESRTVLSNFVVAPTGSDTASGAADAPWKTLQRAADMARPGDTVTVQAGKYAGFSMGWNGPQGGTADAPILFLGLAGAVINSRNSKTADGIDLEGTSYVRIQGFSIQNTTGTITRAGIRAVNDSGVVIRDNTVDRCGYWGIYTSFSPGVDIESNTTSRSIKQHGIYVANSADAPIIRDNVAFGNYQCGIHINGDASQGGDGIISGAIIEGNTAYNNGAGGGSAINCDGVQDSVIANNLLYNNHSSGISLYRIDGGGGSTGNSVVNNTVLVASDGRWALNIQNGSTGNSAYNNILYNYASARGSINVSSDSLPGFASDYNIVVSRFTTNGGATGLSLAQWQSRTGQDMHSLVAPPPTQIFVNPSSGDYHLLCGCIAVDRGTALLAPPCDKDGAARGQDAGFDIGCYEYA